MCSCVSSVSFFSPASPPPRSHSRRRPRRPPPPTHVPRHGRGRGDRRPRRHRRPRAGERAGRHPARTAALPHRHPQLRRQFRVRAARRAPQTRSGRGAGGPPVVLVNGRRVSGFQEIRDLPTEAIQRVDILPEEVASNTAIAPTSAS
ncbi:hypothetical protein AB5I41_23055 [Sphingomonas sp. MMS24-JH45]